MANVSKKKVREKEDVEGSNGAGGAKHIHIYQNGDIHFGGIRCIINPRQVRNFDSLLGILTTRLKPSFGAVRNVYTPVNGHRVTHLDKLKNNQQYVAGGTERFKKIQFGHDGIKDNSQHVKATTFSTKRRKKSISNYNFKNINVKQLSIRKNNESVASCRFKTTNKKFITIYIYKNGDANNSPVKFVLGPGDVKTWDSLSKTVADKIQLQSGFVKNGISWTDMARLHRLDGTSIEISELENGKEYVAVGLNENFKLVNYGERKDWKVAAPATNEKRSTNKKKLANGNKITNNQPRKMSDQSEQIFKTWQNEDESNALDGLRSRSSNDEQGKEEETFFEEDDFDESESLLAKMLELEAQDVGIYRAKEMNGVDAIEVQDSPDTIVEIPLDHQIAQEVSEEELKVDVMAKLKSLTLADPQQLIAVASNIRNKRKRAAILNNSGKAASNVAPNALRAV